VADELVVIDPDLVKICIIDELVDWMMEGLYVSTIAVEVAAIVVVRVVVEVVVVDIVRVVIAGEVAVVVIVVVVDGVVMIINGRQPENKLQN